MTPTTSTSNRTVAAAEGLTKRYGPHTAVDDLSFEVPAGQVIGLLGPNGAGKTTAMKMLLGLVRPSGGTAHLLGARLGDGAYGHALRRTGALIESPAIYERLSARQNLRLQAKALGITVDDGRIEELLELVDLRDRAADKAGGYSLGMKQRLGIAISLIGSPSLVILDEPANGLDPAGIVEIRRLLRRLPELGTTVLVSSHQLSEVEQASDSLLVLSNGSLIAAGTTEEILAGRDTNTFRVAFDPADAPGVEDELARIGAFTQSGQAEYAIELPDGRSGRDLNHTLVTAGVFAAEITRTRVNLEDAFLEMTGGLATPEPTPSAPKVASNV